MKLDIPNYLEKFKIDYPQSLFPPDWSMLKQDRCPIAGCHLKLKFPRSGTIVYCNGRKHKKQFVIGLEAFHKIKKQWI